MHRATTGTGTAVERRKRRGSREGSCCEECSSLLATSSHSSLLAGLPVLLLRFARS